MRKQHEVPVIPLQSNGPIVHGPAGAIEGGSERANASLSAPSGVSSTDELRTTPPVIGSVLLPRIASSVVAPSNSVALSSTSLGFSENTWAFEVWEEAAWKAAPSVGLAVVGLAVVGLFVGEGVTCFC